MEALTGFPAGLLLTRAVMPFARWVVGLLTSLETVFLGGMGVLVSFGTGLLVSFVTGLLVSFVTGLLVSFGTGLLISFGTGLLISFGTGLVGVGASSYFRGDSAGLVTEKEKKSKLDKLSSIRAVFHTVS